MEKLSTTELSMWLQDKGFSVDVQEALKASILTVTVFLYLCVLCEPCTTEQETDGEATVAAFATRSGPDCLKDVIPKLGSRLKVYNAIRVVINEGYQQKVIMYHISVCWKQS